MNSLRLFLIKFVFFILPPTRFFEIKRQLVIWAGGNVGFGVCFVSSVRVYMTGKLSIDRDTWIGHEVLFVGGDAPISIGKHCDIAPRVTFVSGSHCIEPDGLHVAGPGYSSPIVIEDGCWICTGATILGGTIIGERSIVAAGAIVKGKFPPGSLIAGIPGRILRKL